MGKVKAYWQEHQEYMEEQEVGLVSPSYQTKEEKEEDLMLSDLDMDEMDRYTRPKLTMKDLDSYAKEVKRKEFSDKLAIRWARLEEAFAKKGESNLKGATLRERIINLAKK